MEYLPRRLYPVGTTVAGPDKKAGWEVLNVLGKKHFDGCQDGAVRADRCAITQRSLEETATTYRVIRMHHV